MLMENALPESTFFLTSNMFQMNSTSLLSPEKIKIKMKVFLKLAKYSNDDYEILKSHALTFD